VAFCSMYDVGRYRSVFHSQENPMVHHSNMSVRIISLPTMLLVLWRECYFSTSEPFQLIHIFHTPNAIRDIFQLSLTYANSSALSSASLGAFLPPSVLKPKSPFFANLSILCSALALYLPAFFFLISLLTWLGDTNSLFS
jgi:hypothetical protein